MACLGGVRRVRRRASAGGVNDREEELGPQGGAAHKGAINVRNCHELGGVGGLDAAALEDPHGGGDLLSEAPPEDPAEVGMDGSSLLGGGGFARPDRPYGLVSHGNAGQGGLITLICFWKKSS